MAERVGFEPTVVLPITGFQDQLLKPLGHLSKERAARNNDKITCTKMKMLKLLLMELPKGIEPLTS